MGNNLSVKLSRTSRESTPVRHHRRRGSLSRTEILESRLRALSTSSSISSGSTSGTITVEGPPSDHGTFGVNDRDIERFFEQFDDKMVGVQLLSVHRPVRKDYLRFGRENYGKKLPDYQNLQWNVVLFDPNSPFEKGEMGPVFYLEVHPFHSEGFLITCKLIPNSRDGFTYGEFHIPPPPEESGHFNLLGTWKPKGPQFLWPIKVEGDSFPVKYTPMEPLLEWRQKNQRIRGSLFHPQLYTPFHHYMDSNREFIDKMKELFELGMEMPFRRLHKYEVNKTHRKLPFFYLQKVSNLTFLGDYQNRLTTWLVYYFGNYEQNHRYMTFDRMRDINFRSKLVYSASLIAAFFVTPVWLTWTLVGLSVTGFVDSIFRWRVGSRRGGLLGIIPFIRFSLYERNWRRKHRRNNQSPA